MKGDMRTEAEYLAIRFAEVPQGADRITTNVQVSLDWRERLLLLFRPLCVELVIDVEAPVKITRTASWAWAARWRWPWTATTYGAVTSP